MSSCKSVRVMNAHLNVVMKAKVRVIMEAVAYLVDIQVQQDQRGNVE